MLNVIELAQNRLSRPTNRMFVEPLQITNPHNHGCQLLRVDVDFQPKQLCGVYLFFQKSCKPMLSGKDAGLMPQIEQPPQAQDRESFRFRKPDLEFSHS